MLLGLVLLCTPESLLAQLQIVSPPEVAHNPALDDSIIYGSPSVFHPPENNKNLYVRLIYFPPLDDAKPHCTSEQYASYQTEVEALQRKDPEDNAIPTFVVRRGGCSFEEKVIFAEAHKAKAVIIVDMTCEQQKADYDKIPGTDKSPFLCRDTSAIMRIIVNRDRPGEATHIPSMLVAEGPAKPVIDKLIERPEGKPIHHPVGDDAKAAVPLLPDVFGIILWNIPKRAKVHMDIWLDPSAVESGHFMSRFVDVLKALGDDIEFTPYYYVTEFPKTPAQNSLCASFDYISDRMFCDTTAVQVRGELSVKEMVRQKCVYYTHPQAVAIQYINEVYKQCHPIRTQKADSFTDECTQNVAKGISGLDYTKVQSCYTAGRPACNMIVDPQNSGACADNTFIIASEVKQRAWQLDAVRINGARYTGPLDATVVGRTVCTAYSTAPASCGDVINGRVTGDTYFDEGGSSIMSAGISFKTFLLVLLGLLVGFAAFLLIYRRMLNKNIRAAMRDEVMLEVRTQLADYAMLADETGSGNEPGPNVGLTSNVPLSSGRGGVRKFAGQLLGSMGSSPATSSSVISSVKHQPLGE